MGETQLRHVWGFHPRFFPAPVFRWMAEGGFWGAPRPENPRVDSRVEVVMGRMECQPQ